MEGCVPDVSLEALGSMGWVDAGKARGPGNRAGGLQGPGGGEKRGASGRDTGQQKPPGLVTEFRAQGAVNTQGCQSAHMPGDSGVGGGRRSPSSDLGGQEGTSADVAFEE